MIENGLQSQSSAAIELGVRRATIADLVETLGITPKRMSNGKAKGLDESDMKALRKALGRRRRKPQAAATVA